MREYTKSEKEVHNLNLPAATAAASLLLVLTTIASTTTRVASSTAAITTLTATIPTTLTAVASTSFTATTVSTTAARVAAATIAAAATTAATAKATAAAAGATFRGLVNTDGTAIELNVIHRSNGCFSIGFLFITNETKTTATTSITVLDNNGFLYFTEFLKLLAEGIFISVPG